MEVCYGSVLEVCMEVCYGSVLEVCMEVMQPEKTAVDPFVAVRGETCIYGGCVGQVTG